MGGLILPFIMIGCGSDSTSSTGVGYYKDSFVKGVSYVCGNKSGKTDDGGMFEFELNKPCSFSINTHQFKTVAADRLTRTGVTIQENDPVIARFLMTLDNNGNADDLIQISDEVALKIESIPSTDTDFALLNAALRTVDSYDGKPISVVDARDHLDKSIGIMTALASASSSTIKQGESITLSASGSTITKGEIASYSWSEGGERLSTEESFSKTDFTLDNHTIVLVIKDAEGNEATDSISFTVTPATAPTKWDNVSAIAANGANELFITSDADNIYLLLKADPTLPDANISNAQFFVNSDNSNLSGVVSGTWTHDRFDYVVKDTGVYHLLGATDYDGIKVQDMSYLVNDKSIEVAIDKTNMPNLTEKLTVGVWLNSFSIAVPNADTLTEFTDTFYVAGADTVPPIFTVSGDDPLVLNVGDTFSEPGVVATDIFDGATVTVTTDSSTLDMSSAGFYTLVYTASDAAGNEATASRMVEVRGAAPATALEVKDLGLLGESVVINHQTRQVWANDNSVLDGNAAGETRGCLVNVTDASMADLKTRFEGYCRRSDYAGFTDWRAPTPLELSKYTVQLSREGIAPGMARHGCTRTIGIEGDVVKAVWTHMMNQPGRIDTGTLTPSGGRCVRGPEDTSTGGFTLQEVGAAKDKVISDDTLMWVNEADASKEACLAIRVSTPGVNPLSYTESKTFCSALDHAGFTDWRDPTSAELSNFVIKTTEANLLPGYEAPCKRLLARSTDGNESSIATRFETNSSLPLGLVSPLETNLISNIGLRCVRALP